MTTIGGEVHRSPEAGVAWHGRLMVLAWGIVLPLGAVLARYYKVAPWQRWPETLDSKFWWYGHLALQYTGVVLATVAIMLVWKLGSDTPWWHEGVGMLVFGLGWTQVVLGWARGSKGGPTDCDADPSRPSTWRGDHYDMTPRRVAFEWAHKLLGYGALVLSVAAIIGGLVYVDAPRWMLAAMLVWWLVLGFACTRLQRAGRNLDTYQALWGPDTSHPGASRSPIGFGIRRR